MQKFVGNRHPAVGQPQQPSHQKPNEKARRQQIAASAKVDVPPTNLGIGQIPSTQQGPWKHGQQQHLQGNHELMGPPQLNHDTESVTSLNTPHIIQNRLNVFDNTTIGYSELESQTDFQGSEHQPTEDAPIQADVEVSGVAIRGSPTAARGTSEEGEDDDSDDDLESDVSSLMSVFVDEEEAHKYAQSRDQARAGREHHQVTLDVSDVTPPIHHNRRVQEVRDLRHQQVEDLQQPENGKGMFDSTTNMSFTTTSGDPDNDESQQFVQRQEHVISNAVASSAAPRQPQTSKKHSLPIHQQETVPVRGGRPAEQSSVNGGHQQHDVRGSGHGQASNDQSQGSYNQEQQQIGAKKRDRQGNAKSATVTEQPSKLDQSITVHREKNKQTHTPTSPASPESVVPVLDYDTENLFKKEYAELRTEKFDDNPRPYDWHLPRNLKGAALEVRLAEAQQKLTPQQQADFFASLPTAEWEETGDWFLKSFGEIVESMVKARKAKREAAAQFEKAVDKRDRAVSIRARKVEAELSSMRSSGQSLLRTPSKSRNY